MTKHNRIEELMAGALYGDLSEADRAELDDALADDPQLQAELEKLQEVVDRIPADQPQLDHDLLPAIRAKLSGKQPASMWQRVLIPLAAAAVVAVSLGLAYLAGDTEPFTDTAVVEETDNLIERALTRSDELLAQGQVIKARELLNDALTARPLDPLAGKVALGVARLAMGQGQYPEALEAFRRVVTDYSDVYEDDVALRAVVLDSIDALADAEKVEFASLYALDAARRTRSSNLSDLEDLVARYPTQEYVVSAAVKEMANRIMTQPGYDTSGGYVKSLEDARVACADPVAIAAIDLEIGIAYRDSLNNRGQAEVHFRKAAEEPVLAQRANAALESLNP